MIDAGVSRSFSRGIVTCGPTIIMTTVATADRAMQLPMLEERPLRSFAPKLWGTDNDGATTTYSSYNITQSKGEKSISTIFATHNNNSKDGKGYLFDVQGNYLEYLLFYDSEFRPEQRTADVIAQFGATRRSMVNATIFSSDLASVTPRDGVIFNGNRNYCVLSRSWDFWNDTVKIKAIEI